MKKVRKIPSESKSHSSKNIALKKNPQDKKLHQESMRQRMVSFSLEEFQSKTDTKPSSPN
jgi:hypothetical protein